MVLHVKCIVWVMTQTMNKSADPIYFKTPYCMNMCCLLLVDGQSHIRALFCTPPIFEILNKFSVWSKHEKSVEMRSQKVTFAHLSQNKNRCDIERDP